MRKSTFRALIVAASAAVLLSAGSCRREKALALDGEYATVSESEWNVKLVLKKGGVAEILEESWEVGEYDSRDSNAIPGRWSAKGIIVTLEYSGITDTLVYDEKLSLQPLGSKGGAPGLIQIRAADPNSILRFYPLWKQPLKIPVE